MAIFDNYPYTNIHELNLQWLLDTMRAIKDEWESFGYSVTAEAVAGEYPNVEVSGDLINGLNFKFTLVKGEKGDKGNTGDTGNGIASVSINSNYQLTFTFTDGTYYTTPSLKGETGAGLEVLDTFATLTQLQQAHPIGSAGDMYLIGTSPNFILYLWSTSRNQWVEGGALSSPSPSVTTPLMDGTAFEGVEFAYSRGDHVHPSDTSKANASDLTALETVVNQKANASDVTAIDDRVTTNTNNIALLTSSKQDLLISGTNIKTLSGNSILGDGDLPFSGINITNYQDSLTSTSDEQRSYTVSGNGIVIFNASVESPSSGGAGFETVFIRLNGNTKAISRQDISATNTYTATTASACLNVSEGDVISTYVGSTRSGNKTHYYNITAFNCTITAQ